MWDKGSLIIKPYSHPCHNISKIWAHLQFQSFHSQLLLDGPGDVNVSSYHIGRASSVMDVRENAKVRGPDGFDRRAVGPFEVYQYMGQMQ